MKNKLKQTSASWRFLFLIIILYLALFFINRNIFLESFRLYGKIILRIIPIFAVVLFLMTLTNYFIGREFILKYFGKKGFKKWLFTIIGGILSSGPIYMWYPLLAEWKKKGLNYGLIACFLYNRAIKIPLIPAAVFYFGWHYVVVLTVVMIIASIFQGIAINKLM